MYIFVWSSNAIITKPFPVIFALNKNTGREEKGWNKLNDMMEEYKEKNIIKKCCKNC